MVKRYKGGLMGSTEAVTSTTDARGMWGTVQATQARNTGNWPALLTTETPGSGSGAGFANGFMTVSNVSVTDSSYTVLNDTPNISTSGGYIKITGRGFVSGCVVYVGGTPATTTTFISSTEVRAQIAAATSNTLMVYVVNPDGSTGIKLSSLVFSGTPSWVTSSTLTSQVSDVVFSISFSATSDSAVTYTLDTGSSLPPGTTLYANGVFTGTVTGISSDTTYSFSVVANDAENQDTSRTFSVTFSVGDANFYLTPVLLNGDATTWITDASANNFLPTVGGDTRPTAFSPYNTTWSGLFNGSTDYLSVASSTDFQFGTGDFTVECWVYFTSAPGGSSYYPLSCWSANSGWELYYRGVATAFSWYYQTSVLVGTTVPVSNRWYHIAASRSSGTTRLFVNGSIEATLNSDTTNFTPSSALYVGIETGNTGAFPGYISNVRVIKGAALYTSAFTPATTALTATAETKLLACQSNRFIDANTTPKTITIAGTPQIKSFSPFADTDTTTGSAYFDGTGDYLSIGTAANWVSLHNTSAQWTMDFWVYPITYNGGLIETCDSSTQIGMFLGLTAGGLVVLEVMRGVTSSFVIDVYGSVVVPKGMWSHIQVSYDYSLASNNVAIYVNGTVNTATLGSLNKTANAPSSSNPTSPLYVGYSTSTQFQGYITDLRIRTGIAVSTAPTLPTTSVSSNANTQLLTLQYRVGDNNHRFVDESGLKSLTTRAGNASQGTFTPFSPAGWSAYFDGTGDYLICTHTTTFGTGDFTVECWVYMPVITNTNGSTIIGTSNYNGVDRGWALEINASGFPRFNLYNSAGTGSTITSSTLLTANQWTHLAAVRSGTTVTLYRNGVSVASGTMAQSDDLSGSIYIATNSTSFALGVATYSYAGYISNARVIKGTAQYTANFTPATSSLTSISDTRLLTLQNNRFIDNSANNATITKTGDVKIQAFSPFRGSGSYSPATHGGSAYFDGSGDAVNVTNSPAVTLGTNNHCIEFWIYPNGAQNQYTTIWYYNSTSQYYFSIPSDAGGSISLLLGPLSGSWQLQFALSSTEYTNLLNVWTHIVITRSNGNAFRLFLNGILKAYGTSSQSIAAQTSALYIGWDGTNATTYYKGWLSNFRVINGSIPTAYQTASTTTGTTIFTPPTSVPAFEANTVIQTNFTNAGIYDATGRTNFETVGDAKISNVASKFGTGSLYFDGTGDYIVAPSNPLWAFGTGDFTVECWVYFISVSGTFVPFVQSDTVVSSTNDKWFFALGSSTLRFQTHASGGFTCTTPWTPVTSTWYHVAATRTSGTIRLFIDGTSGSVSTTGTPSGYNLGQGGLAVGAITTPYYFNGYIDELRITRYSRYTASFTAPTSAFLTK